MAMEAHWQQSHQSRQHQQTIRQPFTQQQAAAGEWTEPPPPNGRNRRRRRAYYLDRDEEQGRAPTTDNIPIRFDRVRVNLIMCQADHASFDPPCLALLMTGWLIILGALMVRSIRPSF